MTKKILAIIFAVFLFISLVQMDTARGAITGKIAGKVTDAKTGEALPGANIIIEGTTMGAASNVKGEYFIINVPPGVYTLTCKMIGYATTRMTQVQVKSDLTTQIDFALQQQVIQGQEVTVVAKRAIIQKDIAGTEVVMDKQEMNAFSQNSFLDFMLSQGGVEYQDNSNGAGLSIRGGDIDESNVIIDGISMRNALNKQAGLGVALSAVKEVSISPGGVSAEYGDIRSGIVKVVTREGSRSNYSFAFDARIAPPQKKHFYENSWSENGWIWKLYAGPQSMHGIKDEQAFLDYYHMNNDITNTRFPGGYYGYLRDIMAKSKDPASVWQTPMQHLEEFRWARNGKIRPYADEPDWVLDGSMGGPVPFTKNATFLIADHYENYQLITPGLRKNSISNTAQLNVTFRLNPSMKLTWMNVLTHAWGLQGAGRQATLSGFFTANRRSYSGIHSNEEPSWETPEAHKVTLYSGLRFSHTLSPSTFYTLQVDFSKYNSRGGYPWKDIWERKWYQGPYDDVFDIPLFRVGNRYAPKWGMNPEIDYWPAIPLSKNFKAFGIPLMPHDDSRYWTGHIKGTLESQISYRNNLKLGFEFNYSDLDAYAWGFRPAKGAHLPPFFLVNSNPDVGAQYIIAKPFTAGAFIQDKLEYEGMIATIGLRYDLFNAGQGAWDVNSWEGGWTLNDFKDDIAAQEGNPVPWAGRRTKGWAYRQRVSPRLGISFPATQTSKFYFNYGHYYTMPNPSQVFFINTKGSAIKQVPNLNAEWPKSVSYEVGFEKALSDEFLFRVSAYYKDDTNQLAWVSYKAPGGSELYRTQEPLIYRDIRGFEIRLQQRQGTYGYGYLNFEYRTWSDGITGFQERYQNETEQATANRFTPQQSIIWPRPNLNFVYSFRLPVGFGPRVLGFKPLSDWTLQLNGRWRDGGKVLFASGTFASERKYLDRIDTHNLDIALRKRFQWGFLSYTFYMNIYNVTNFKGSMGDLNSTDYMTSLHVPWGNEGVNKGNDKWGQGPMDKGHEHIWSSNRPWRWFLNPRTVWFGLQLTWR